MTSADLCAPDSVSIEELVQSDALGGELVAILATLHDQPSGVAELMLGTLGYGSRMLLEGARAIDDAVRDPEQPARIAITERGWELIAYCASRDPADELQARRELERRRQAWVAENADQDALVALEQGAQAYAPRQSRIGRLLRGRRAPV